MESKKKLVFATNNRHKADEIKRMLGPDYQVLTLAEIGCDEEIEENADTLEGNAEIKARYVKEHYGYDCFADDTGLEVNALNGAPGVMSARYAGPGHDSKANMKKLLHNLSTATDRKARFRTVIALIQGDELTLMDGTVEGEITCSPSGTDGFGYDPVFRPDGYDCTFAEMTADAKNAISHRGRATAKLIDFLSKNR